MSLSSIHLGPRQLRFHRVQSFRHFHRRLCSFFKSLHGQWCCNFSCDKGIKSRAKGFWSCDAIMTLVRCWIFLAFCLLFELLWLVHLSFYVLDVASQLITMNSWIWVVDHHHRMGSSMCNCKNDMQCCWTRLCLWIHIWKRKWLHMWGLKLSGSDLLHLARDPWQRWLFQVFTREIILIITFRIGETYLAIIHNVAIHTST